MRGSNKVHEINRNFGLTCSLDIQCMILKHAPSVTRPLRTFTPGTTFFRMSTTASTPKVTPGTVPAGYKAHTESSTTILVPEANTAFLNPVQQYNRDLSIAVIRAWNDMRKEEALAKHEFKMQRKSNGKGKGKVATVEENGEAGANGDQAEAGPSKPVSHQNRETFR
jgi:hypothetical protein